MKAPSEEIYSKSTIYG